MKMKTKAIVLLLIVITIISYSNHSNAITGEEIVIVGNEFVGGGTLQIEEPALQDLSKGINAILLGLGTVVILGAGVFLGVQFMTGSASSKAKVMDSLVPFVIGAIVIFGAYTIWQACVTFVERI